MVFLEGRVDVSEQDASVQTGLILGLHPANRGRRYNVTLSLIGWKQT